MKKRIISLMLALLVIGTMLAFAGCNEQPSEQNGTTTTTNNTSSSTNAPEVDTMTLVIGTATPTSYTVELDKVDQSKGIMGVLEYLKQEKGLEYESDDTGYGAFLTKVGVLEQSGGTYIYLYTSVEKDADVSQYATTIDYNGKTLCSSGVGASEMTIEDDCVIYVGTIEY